MADKREHAHQAFDLFLETYQAKYPKAAECLNKDREGVPLTIILGRMTSCWPTPPLGGVATAGRSLIFLEVDSLLN